MAFLNIFKRPTKKDSAKATGNPSEEKKASSFVCVDKKSTEKQATSVKMSINSVYNKKENYKPLSQNSITQTEEDKLYCTYGKILNGDILVDIDALKKTAWQGVPKHLRSTVWKILLKYMPINREKRESTVLRKREEYHNFVKMYYFNLSEKELDEADQKALKQIKDDVVRTSPDYNLFHNDKIQEIMIRLLWVWHVRHPASGYVQGINDLVTPFLGCFLGDFCEIDYDTFQVPENLDSCMDDEKWKQLEADTYWCLTKILDGILDNYTFSQTGTQKALDKIKDITKKIDSGLYKHLNSNGINFSYFSVKWMFCLLIREFPLKVGMRLFDTYISDDQGFSVLHIYVCAALLLKWSVKLKKMDFSEMMMFLGQMPTKNWTENDIQMLVAEAYVFMTLYEETQGNYGDVTSRLSTQTSNYK